MKFKQRAIALLLMATIMCALSGCSLAKSVISSTSQISTYPSTQPAATNPPKQAEDFAHSYNSLKDDKVKELYMNIAENAQRMVSVPFKVEGELTGKQIFEAVQAYKNDHPEVFWLLNETSYLFDNGYTTVYIFFNSNMDSVERKEAKEKFNSAVEKILSKAPADASDYEKELFVNNYLVDNCEYDYDAIDRKKILNNENDAYGALVDKKAVCEGYARAFQLLCNRLGIDCVTMSGTTDGGSHAWNCAMLDNEWYQVDVTWNDTEKQDSIVENFYFNLTDEQMYSNHTAAPLYSEYSDEEFEKLENSCNEFVPICTGTKYNYFRQSCVTLTDINESDDIVEAIAEAAKSDAKNFSFVIDDSLDFKSTYDTIVYDGYIAEWVDSANLKNWYSPNLNDICKVYRIDTLKVITIEFEYI